jgi:hypothetical protein
MKLIMYRLLLIFPITIFITKSLRKVIKTYCNKFVVVNCENYFQILINSKCHKKHQLRQGNISKGSPTYKKK